MPSHATLRLLAVGLLAAFAVAGCATIRETVALRDVDFSLQRVTDVRLAGIRVDRLERWTDLAPIDALTITDAVRRGRLPLTATLHVGAENPAANAVAARLEDLDWTLLLRDREAARGGLQRRGVTLPPGRLVEIPVDAELDLMEVFAGDARDLAGIALELASGGGVPTGVELRLRPTIRTPLGPISPGEVIVGSGAGARRGAL